MAHKPLKEPPMAGVSVLFHHFLTYVPQTARERFFLFLRQAILTCPSLLCSLIVLLDLLAAFSYHSNLYFSFISLCFYFLSEGYIDYIIHIILFFLPHYHRSRQVHGEKTRPAFSLNYLSVLQLSVLNGQAATPALACHGHGPTVHQLLGPRKDTRCFYSTHHSHLTLSS